MTTNSLPVYPYDPNRSAREELTRRRIHRPGQSWKRDPMILACLRELASKAKPSVS